MVAGPSGAGRRVLFSKHGQAQVRRLRMVLGLNAPKETGREAEAKRKVVVVS